jgi:hypothetical protein
LVDPELQSGRAGTNSCLLTDDSGDKSTSVTKQQTGIGILDDLLVEAELGNYPTTSGQNKRLMEIPRVSIAAPAKTTNKFDEESTITNSWEQSCPDEQGIRMDTNDVPLIVETDVENHDLVTCGVLPLLGNNNDERLKKLLAEVESLRNEKQKSELELLNQMETLRCENTRLKSQNVRDIYQLESEHREKEEALHLEYHDQVSFLARSISKKTK